MSSYRKKSDWGCVGWFLLAFTILSVVIWLIVLASTPSGGGSGGCQSLANLDRLYKGNSTAPVKYRQTTVFHPVGVSGGSGSRPAQPKTQKPPKGGSGSPHKAPHVDLDIGDCD